MPVKDQRKVEITQQHKQSIIDTLQKQGIKNKLPPKSLRVTEIISKLVSIFKLISILIYINNVKTRN